jgi:hypothetical protein
MSKRLHDQRWFLHYDKKKNDKIKFEYLDKLLKRGPEMVAYYEPKVKGFHMNVIVAGAGLGDVASGLVVIDQNYNSFHTSNLQYYKNYYSDIYLIYKVTRVRRQRMPTSKVIKSLLKNSKPRQRNLHGFIAK